MGADFVAKSKRSFQKAWDRGRLSLATADLLNRLPTVDRRTFAAELANDARVACGDMLLVESTAREIRVSASGNEVAQLRSPSSELLAAIQQSHGVATAVVRHVHEISGVADLEIVPATPKQ